VNGLVSNRIQRSKDTRMQSIKDTHNANEGAARARVKKALSASAAGACVGQPK
jgi:hypothetical protein